MQTTTTEAPRQAAAPEPADRIIRERECARLSGLSRKARWEAERSGRFPKRRQLGPRAVGWRLSEVLAWLESLETVKDGRAGGPGNDGHA